MTVGIAVVGVGHWGPHLVRSFSDNDVSDLQWIVEKDDDRRRAIASRFGESRTTADLSEALADGNVDAVAVATPTSTHSAVVMQALEAGKHVLVEKPLADSLDDALRLKEKAHESGLTLMVGHVFLFNAAIREAKRLIDEHVTGSVRYISMVRTNLGPIRHDVDAGWDLLAHDVSISNYWLDAMPTSVSATGGSWINPGVNDAVFATMTYPNGVMVHAEASWLSPRKRRLISVVGKERMLTVDDMDLNEPLRIYDRGVEVEPSVGVEDTFVGFRAQIREGQVVIPRIAPVEPLKAECQAFLDRVRGESDHVSDGREGAQVVAVLEAISQSSEKDGLSVAVPQVS